MEKMGFVARMRSYFGQKPGQTVLDFGKELKELTSEDKYELYQLFNEAGLPTDPPSN